MKEIEADDSRERRQRCPGGRGWVLRGGSWLKVLVPSGEMSICSVKTGHLHSMLVQRTGRYISPGTILFKSEQERLAM